MKDGYDFEVHVEVEGERYVFTADRGDELGDVWSADGSRFLFDLPINADRVALLAAHPWTVEWMVRCFLDNDERRAERARQLSGMTASGPRCFSQEEIAEMLAMVREGRDG